MDTCTIFDTVIQGTRFMWLADMEQEKCELFIDMYKNDLRCDVVQIAHHGNAEGDHTKNY